MTAQVTRGPYAFPYGAPAESIARRRRFVPSARESVQALTIKAFKRLARREILRAAVLA